MGGEFDRYAPVYDDAVQQSISFSGQDLEVFTRRKVDVLLDLAREHVGDPSGLRVLDAGCGVGVTDEMLAPEVGELHGVDTSAAAVEAAASRNPSVRYSTTDGVRFDHPSDHFDLSVAICVMHHVPPPDRVRFTTELRRVTRPGGLVVVFEHNPLNPFTRLAVSRCEFDEGVVLVGRRALRGLADRTGLRTVSARYILFVPRAGRGIERFERAIGWLPLGAQHVRAAKVDG